MTTANAQKVVVIGAGMAGLSVGFHLQQQIDQQSSGLHHSQRPQHSQQRQIDFQVFEGSEHYGGLARSFQWHGVDCDFAPHRLFTQDEQLLDEILSLVDCHPVQRRSRIRIVNQWIADPINVLELLTTISPWHAVKIVASFIAIKLRKTNSGDSFSSFVKAHYGKGLDELFFKPYAEKLFGIPANRISRVWGEKKIRVAGLRDMMRRNNKLYFDHFYYPKKGGYGAIVNALAQPIEKKIHSESKLLKLVFDRQQQQYRCTFQLASGEQETVNADVVISTVPMPVLLNAMGHQIKLSYRPAKLVYLHIARAQVMADQWVYLVDEKHRINRISEFKNFNCPMPSSTDLSTDSAHSDTVETSTVICAEVTNTEQFSVSAVVDELVSLGLIEMHEVLDTKVIDIGNAYPIYDLEYQQRLSQAEALLADFPQLYQVGRQAQFKHQDVDEIYASAKQLVTQLTQT